MLPTEAEYVRRGVCIMNLLSRGMAFTIDKRASLKKAMFSFAHPSVCLFAKGLQAAREADITLEHGARYQ